VAIDLILGWDLQCDVRIRTKWTCSGLCRALSIHPSAS